MTDSATRKLLQEHYQIGAAWARSNFGGPKPCIKCECEIEEWWNYCATCGYHLAANPPVK